MCQGLTPCTEWLAASGGDCLYLASAEPELKLLQTLVRRYIPSAYETAAPLKAKCRSPVLNDLTEKALTRIHLLPRAH